MSAQERISIGDGSMIADYVTIRDQNHIKSPEVPLSCWQFTSAPVLVGDDVWITSKATVVAGVTIGDHALCAADAVVTKDVKPCQKIGGVPARPLKAEKSSTEFCPDYETITESRFDMGIGGSS